MDRGIAQSRILMDRDPDPERKPAFGITTANFAASRACSAVTDGASIIRLGLSFPQIATGDLDILIVGQLPAANLPLSDEFEPGAVQVVGFEAPFRREGL